jgi:transcription antitermination factor NusG
MPLDRHGSQVLENARRDCGTSLAKAPQSGGCAQWHCVWTEPIREFLALCELREQGFHAYLPLHLDRHADRHAERNCITPLFKRYLFVRFIAKSDPWGSILRTRGVVALITHGIGKPTPVAPGVVEELIARTSHRGVVDDPGDARKPATRQHWQNITALSADARTALLLRLFGA